MRVSRPLRLGILLYPTGYHIAAWRHPSTLASGGTDIAHYVELARLAEEARLDFLFLADSLAMQDAPVETLSRSAIRYVSQFEPLTLLGALSVATSRIGLVATASTTYQHPFHLARMVASIDHLSNGRAGWNAVAGSNPAEARNFGETAHPPHAVRYARAREATAIVRGLWDSWSADAFLYDKENGRFFDPACRRTLNHRGDYFSVAGPLHIARSPQGHPPIFQAGSSSDGMGFAAEFADVVFTAQQSLDDACDFAARMRQAAAAAGRQDRLPPILPGIMPFLGSTEAVAKAKWDELNALVEPEVGLSLLEGLLPGVSLTGVSVDSELPPVTDTEASWSRQSLLERMARAERLSIRDLYERIAASRGHLTLVGTPAQVADTLETWHRQGAADGFVLVPHALPTALHDIAEFLLPELRRRGLAREAYEGATLRTHLGLDPVA